MLADDGGICLALIDIVAVDQESRETIYKDQKPAEQAEYSKHDEAKTTDTGTIATSHFKEVGKSGSQETPLGKIRYERHRDGTVERFFVPRYGHG